MSEKFITIWIFSEAWFDFLDTRLKPLHNEA